MDSYINFGENTARRIWTVFEHNVKFVCIFLGINVLCLFIAVIITSHKNNELNIELEQKQEQICYTPGCIKKAANILKNMNSSVDPCEDFHKFACTKFIDEIEIPEDQPWVTAFKTFKVHVYKELRGMLEESTKPNEPRPITLAKRLYQSCMNTRAIEEDGLKTIKNIIDNLGGWPILEGASWYDGKFDWKQAMYVLRSNGYEANYFLSVYIMKDLKNTSRRIINIDKAHLEVYPEILHDELRNSAVMIYFRYMTDVVELFGANETLVRDELQETLNLEIALAKIFPTYEEQQNQSNSYNPVTVAELQRLYPLTNWKKYLKYLLDIPNFQLTDSDMVNLRVPKYLNDLEDLLKNTSNRVIANYIMWRVVSSSTPYITSRLGDLKLNFTKMLMGIVSSKPRWKQCLNETLYSFWGPLKTTYDMFHFHIEAKKVATKMLQNIKQEFINLLQDTEWMDEETKNHALEKIHSYDIYINPFDFKTDEDLTDPYSKLNFSSNIYLTNVLAVSLFNSNQYYKSLREPVKNTAASMDISLETKMYMPGGIFNEEFFHADLPYYVNYGSIGYLMGHMIAHLFDTKGRQLDKNGELNSWWSNNTEINLKNKTKCLIQKFSNYTLPDMKINLNGRKTLDENFADNAGIKVAYLAYSRWIEENGIEQQLPGLNYTAKQMFWISLANVYCSKYRRNHLVLVTFLGTFAPCYYRIIGSFSNSEYFAKDFNCPIGSRMNPEVKCDVW